MAEPVRLRLSRAKGFDLQALSRATNGLPAVNCARPGRLGNPFTIEAAIESGFVCDEISARPFVVRCFRDWLSGAGAIGGRDWWTGRESDKRKAAIRAGLSALRGHNLACWCPLPAPGEPDICHAAVLLEVANAEMPAGRS